MGDHTETLEIDFDSEMITFEQILNLFWKHHNPLRVDQYKGRQYMSILLYHNEQQKELAIKVKNEYEQLLQGQVQTEIAPYSHFYLAENYHQKYFLRRYPHAYEKLASFYSSQEELVHSTLAARLNGFVKGYGTWDGLKQEINDWELSPDERRHLMDLLSKIRW